LRGPREKGKLPGGKGLSNESGDRRVLGGDPEKERTRRMRRCVGVRASGLETDTGRRKRKSEGEWGGKAFTENIT